MSIPLEPKPRSEKTLEYIKRKGISEYENRETVFCYLFEDMQVLFEEVKALEKEVKQLKER